MKAKQVIRRTQVLARLVLCGLCAAAPLAAAELNSRAIPDVRVWNEANHNVPLQSVLTAEGGGPVILLPIYTRCGASCPVLTRKLEEEAARMDSGIAYRVLVFSFDPSESSKSLEIFRRQEQVPANWAMVRADEGEIRQFFDFLHYPVMTEGDMLIHPSEIFLLDDGLNWRGTLVGVDWSSAELQRQLSRIETRGLAGWIAMNPAALAVMGFGGMLLSLGLLIGWLIFHKPPKRRVAA